MTIPQPQGVPSIYRVLRPIGPGPSGREIEHRRGGTGIEVLKSSAIFPTTVAHR